MKNERAKRLYVSMMILFLIIVAFRTTSIN